MEQLDHIHIFKTNIARLTVQCDLHKALSNHNSISAWSIDHDDVDRVLRVVSETLQPNDIIAMVSKQGYDCCELD